MFSSTHGSQCDSKYNYIPEYIIEDESNDTSHEIRTLEAVESEILGDYDKYNKLW
jgi:UDP-N-acetylglucosamine pyrophosphorylase